MLFGGRGLARPGTIVSFFRHGVVVWLRLVPRAAVVVGAAAIFVATGTILGLAPVIRSRAGLAAVV